MGNPTHQGVQGHKYDYGVADLDGVTFADAPIEMAQARDEAQRLSQQFFGPDDEPFNEIYMAAYFEDMGMTVSSKSFIGWQLRCTHLKSGITMGKLA